MTSVFIKRGNLDTDTDMHIGRIPCEEGSYTARSQGTSGTTRSWKKQGSILLYRFQWEHEPANSLTSDFWPADNKYLLF